MENGDVISSFELKVQESQKSSSHLTPNNPSRFIAVYNAIVWISRVDNALWITLNTLYIWDLSYFYIVRLSFSLFNN